MIPQVADIHTHHLKHDALVNAYPGQPLEKGYLYSCGIHPWHTDEATAEKLQQLDRYAAMANVVAIGETGLDTLRGASLDKQERIFRHHVELSEKYAKPMIIHCVKAWQQIIALHRELKPSQPWIIHGFRGKPQLAADLLKEGFYLSLGANFNPATAEMIPADRLLFETDDLTSEITIDQVKKKIMKERE